jgi:hypothetical protein
MSLALKIGPLSNFVKNGYVNPKKSSAFILFFSCPVEKPVDNVENSWPATPIPRFFPNRNAFPLGIFGNFLMLFQLPGQVLRKRFLLFFYG